MESVINKAIEWFKNISEETKKLTSGNVSHNACAIRGLANGSAEYLEEHKGSSSVIKWQTGKPRKEGKYIVSLFDGRVMIDELYSYEYVEGSSSTIEFAWRCNFFDAVIAWCKLSDIEPYKEETK